MKISYYPQALSKCLANWQLFVDVHGSSTCTVHMFQLWASTGRGRGPPPWIFILGTDVVDRSLIVLFFGVFSLPLEIILLSPLFPGTKPHALLLQSKQNVSFITKNLFFTHDVNTQVQCKLLHHMHDAQKMGRIVKSEPHLSIELETGCKSGAFLLRQLHE